MKIAPASAPVQPLRSTHSATREFAFFVVPVVCALLVAGYVAAQWQHGFLPGADRPFPLAGVRVPNWHIFWMGLWTGYTMALVGQAAGIFALAYSMSILQFTSPAITPTTLVLSFLNPIGALLGFRRTGQWNLAIAKWVCIGGLLGGMLGPFLRLTILSEPRPFRLLVGAALAIMGLHLLKGAFRQGRESASAQDAAANIETLQDIGGRLVIGCGGERWTLGKSGLFLTGAGVGAIGSALGVGGGFLLVPILVTAYQLPMYVLVAITIPYVIVNAAVGLFTYAVMMPLVAHAYIDPEWSWGLFAAAGGVLGAWLAAKAQRSVPEHLLRLMLGGVTAIAGTLYVLDFFVELPFRI
jgi:uncharacterized protein